MQSLQQIKIVDLREGRSVWDEEKSDPKTGQYVFEKKVYVTRKSYHQPGHSDKWFGWCRYTPEGREMSEWQYGMGYEPVVAGKDPYWPEPIKPGINDWYIAGDAILMACPLINYLEMRKLAEDMSRGGGKARLKKFQAEAKRFGMDVPEEMLDGRVEELTEEQEILRKSKSLI